MSTVSLTWARRTTKTRRKRLVEIIRSSYPDAHDAGHALRFSMPECDGHLVWLLMLCRDFTGIERDHVAGAGKKVRRKATGHHREGME